MDDANREARSVDAASGWGAGAAEGRRRAPGAPGVDPHWATGAKQGVGTAVASSDAGASRVWFTIARGALTEVYYPRTDCGSALGLGLIVTDGDRFFSDETRDAEHLAECAVEGVPLYRLANTCREGRYRVEKEILTHPRHHVVLQRTTFEPRSGGLGDYHLFISLRPRRASAGSGDSAWLGSFEGRPMLFARCRGGALALACSTPWAHGTVGLVGASDGAADIADHGRLTRRFDEAGEGNAALTAEVDLVASGGRFTLALGFGADGEEAGRNALAGLLAPIEEVRDAYVAGWCEWQAGLSMGPSPRQGRDLSRPGAMVLKVHQDRSASGAIVASLAVPWGESRSTSEEGYHLVWPRDFCEAAGGLLAVGAADDAARALRFLEANQAEDGHWAQDMWVGGAAHWEGIQLGETAIVLMLLDHLRRERAVDDDEVARLWPMVRRAIGYLVRYGPATQQDRWENQNGYTPFTLSLVISAFLIASDLADERGEAEAAAYLKETADAWNASIERWLYVEGTDLARRVGVDGYYARIIPPARPGDRDFEEAKDRGLPPEEVVSPDALALVRYGLRAADDPRIADTVRVIDAVLRVETPSGPCWRRYNGDGYGEHDDGSPFDGRVRGAGRAWPLLTGERGHFELAAGRVGEAERLLAAMAGFADETGMIPEQVWDAADIPARGLRLGRPSGSAMPLVWAHAEYLKLRRSLREGRIFDRPPQAARRYQVLKVGSDLAIWRLDERRGDIAPGRTLRVELHEPAVVRWTTDDGTSRGETATRDTTLGIHVADLPTAGLGAGTRIRFEFGARGAGGRGGEHEVVVGLVPGSKESSGARRGPRDRS